MKRSSEIALKLLNIQFEKNAAQKAFNYMGWPVWGCDCDCRRLGRRRRRRRPRYPRRPRRLRHMNVRMITRLKNSQ